MKKYEAPSIAELGSVADFTHGEGWDGSHDKILFIRWGEPPQPTPNS